MKKNILIIFLLFVSLNVFSQCDNSLIDRCRQKIGKATYIKHFKVRFEEGRKKKPQEKKYSILLNKGNHYRFNIENDKSRAGKGVIKLWNDYTFYGSSFDKDDGTTYEYFDFFCSKTGVYYVSLYFIDAKKGCAVAMVSLVGSYSMH